ncbi:hypothetical protein NC653_022057 [Populus alba x Populus x berolinensis]|uniref:Uncharacterized protein n=1 Tax=Populus alba x Populus x berolinensis TaxID=444605 RepID=A0AAD6VTY5_9ROSI|nr:hypothetical protein NC653_022057 [Populus alba x Populus x berolinensis]
MGSGNYFHQDCWSRKSGHWWTTAKISMQAMDRARIPAIRAFKLHRTENQGGSVELICLMSGESSDSRAFRSLIFDVYTYAMKHRSASIWQMTKQAKRGKGRVAGSITILEQSMLMTMRGTRMLGFAGNQLLIQEGLE